MLLNTAKMEKLLDLLIEGKGIDPDEYQRKKQKLLNEKLEIQQKVKDFEQQELRFPHKSDELQKAQD